MVNHKVSHHVQQTQHSAAARHYMAVYRQQFLTELHRQLVDALLSFLYSCLRSVVEDVVLTGGRCRLVESLVRLLLLPSHHLQFA